MVYLGHGERCAVNGIVIQRRWIKEPQLPRYALLADVAAKPDWFAAVHQISQSTQALTRSRIARPGAPLDDGACGGVLDDVQRQIKIANL